MFNFKVAADRLAWRLCNASDAVAVFIMVHDMFATKMDNMAAAAVAWIVMQGFSFVLKAWSDGLPDH